MQRNHFQIIVCFKPCQINITVSFVLGKHVIPARDQGKCLDIIVSETNCDNNLKGQMRKHYPNFIIFLQKLSYCSTYVKCFTFKSYCATTDCPMLFDSNVTSMKKLKFAYSSPLQFVSLKRLLICKVHPKCSAPEVHPKCTRTVHPKCL